MIHFPLSRRSDEAGEAGRGRCWLRLHFGQAAACLLLAEESFVAVALRAIKHKQPTVLKAYNSTGACHVLEQRGVWKGS